MPKKEIWSKRPKGKNPLGAWINSKFFKRLTAKIERKEANKEIDEGLSEGIYKVDVDRLDAYNQLSAKNLKKKVNKTMKILNRYDDRSE